MRGCSSASWEPARSDGAVRRLRDRRRRHRVRGRVLSRAIVGGEGGARGAGQARRGVQPLRLRPHEGDAPIGEDRGARAGRRTLRLADPRGRGRLRGGAAACPRPHRCAVRRGSRAARARGCSGVPAGGPPPWGASGGARGRHGDRGGQGRARHRNGGVRPRDPGTGGGAVLDESGGDLGTPGRPRLARRDRHRRGRDRVRADLRALRLARHGAGGPPSSPPAGRRGGRGLAHAGPGGRRDRRAPRRADRSRRARRRPLDPHPGGKGSRPRRRTARRDRAPADVRPPRPGRGGDRAGRRREPGLERHAPNHRSRRLGGGRRDRRAALHARRHLRSGARRQGHPRTPTSARTIGSSRE